MKKKGYVQISRQMMAGIAFLTFLLGASPAVANTPGSLAQFECIYNSLSSPIEGCYPGRALDAAEGVTVSPDAKNAYVASAGSDSVGVFDRNPVTGALTQKLGVAGCISEDPTMGTPDDTTDDCTDGRGLDHAGSVTVSPDSGNVYVASSISDSVAIFDRDPATGALTQKPGIEGCISETGTGGQCADGKALNGTAAVTVSPDGKNVYVGSLVSDAVAVFDRNLVTGALTQKPGIEGCVSETGTGGQCADGKALDHAGSVTVSPDAKNAYVASFTSDAVAIFDRDPATGALTQKPGTEGCVSETGTGGQCADGRALSSPYMVVVSPDAKNAYVGSYASDALAVFDRNSDTGALTQKPGTEGCVSETGTGGQCADGKALEGVTSVTVSPDAKNAYVTSINSHAVAVFDHDPYTGALTQRFGIEGCVSETGTTGQCADGTALKGAASVTVSPDAKNAYVASLTSDAVVAFNRVIPQSGTDPGPDTFPPGPAPAPGPDPDLPPDPADFIRNQPASAFRKACNLRITSPKLKTKRSRSKRRLRVSRKKARRLFTHGAKGYVKWGTVAGQKIKCEKIKIILLQKRGRRYYIPGTGRRVYRKSLVAKRFYRTVRRLKKRKIGRLRQKNAAHKRMSKFSFKDFNRSSKLGRSALDRLRGRSYQGTFFFYLVAEIEGRKIVKRIKLHAGK